MSIERQFRACCEFCESVGPWKSTEKDAASAAAKSPAKVVRLRCDVYGNDTWACAKCIATNEEVKQYAARDRELREG